MVNLNITGTNLTLTDGATSRQYAVPDATIDTTTLQIFVSGIFLHSTTDYTISGQTITFLNAIFNVQPITIDYWLTGSTSSTTSYYNAGTTSVYNFMGLTQLDATEIGLTDTMVLNALSRAEDEIKSKTKTHFAVSTDSTPDYLAIDDEKHDGQGVYDRTYFTNNYPLPNVSTQANGIAAVGATTVTVDSTNGFPSSGTVFSGVNKIAYTGKTLTTFTGVSGLTVAIANNDYIYPFGVEVSLDDQGTSPTYTVLTQGDQYDLDLRTGRFYLYLNNIIPTLYTITQPPKYTPNRMRVNYIYGWESIPADITRVTIMIASRDLTHMIVRRSTMRGLNNFNPSMIDVDQKLIDETIARYQNIMIENIH